MKPLQTPQQDWELQERLGEIGGIIGAILLAAFGVWVWGNIAIPESNMLIAILLGTFSLGYLGIVGFFVSVVLVGVLSTPPKKS